MRSTGNVGTVGGGPVVRIVPAGAVPPRLISRLPPAPPAPPPPRLVDAGAVPGTCGALVYPSGKSSASIRPAAVCTPPPTHPCERPSATTFSERARETVTFSTLTLDDRFPSVAYEKEPVCKLRDGYVVDM